MSRGDHIYVERLGGLYAHHGIDCGDDTVIHYMGPNAMRSRVRRSELDAFHQGAAVRVREYGDLRSPLDGVDPRYLTSRFVDALHGRRLVGQVDTSPDAVVARAESRLGEAGFDFVFQNCEHFATWCRTGISRSRQAEAVLWPLGGWLPPESLFR